MGNPLIKPGGWPADVATLTGSEAQQLDEAQAASLDGSGGGSYEPTADINVTDGAGGAFGDIDVHGQIHFKGDDDPRSTYKVSSDITVTNNQDFGISGGQYRRFVDHSGEPAKDHRMSNTGAIAGDWIEFIRPAGGTSAINLRVDGVDYAQPIIASLPGVHSTATIYFTGTDWALAMYGGGTSAGPAA